jgi:hypothetical protein
VDAVDGWHLMPEGVVTPWHLTVAVMVLLPLVALVVLSRRRRPLPETLVDVAIILAVPVVGPLFSLTAALVSTVRARRRAGAGGAGGAAPTRGAPVDGAPTREAPVGAAPIREAQTGEVQTGATPTQAAPTGTATGARRPASSAGG